MKNNSYSTIFKKMIEIRRSQEMLIAEYHPADQMRCPIHFCLGQEVLAACLHFFLKKKDYVLSHHRSHGYYLAKGCPLDKMVAEFYGKASGSNAGLTGSQEVSYPKKFFFSGTILSGMFSIALGTSFAQKINKKGVFQSEDLSNALSLEKKNFRGIWANYFLKEWSSPGNAEFAKQHGMHERPEPFDPNSIGTFH